MVYPASLGVDLLWCLLLFQNTGSRLVASVVVASGLSSCSTQAWWLRLLGSRHPRLQLLWPLGSVTPWHVGFSLTRD